MKELAELRNKYLDSSNELENLFVKTLNENNINRNDLQCINNINIFHSILINSIFGYI